MSAPAKLMKQGDIVQFFFLANLFFDPIRVLGQQYATGLTAITDNAALTYLASLVQGVSDEFKYAIVAGAVTGGGLSIIANAPNPAGIAILKGGF